MAIANLRAPRVGSKETALAILGGVALIAAAAGIRARLDTAGPPPVVAAPAVREPLYVLPPQPADLIGAAPTVAPDPSAPAWQLTLLTARHPEP